MSASGQEALGRIGRLVLTNCESYEHFPLAHAERLAADFPHATLIPVPGARTWVPVDNPAALAGAIADFVPAQVA